MRKNNGFTLIELMIVIALIIIMAVVAVAYYSSFMRKSRRADGVNAIMTISLAQERYRSNNSTYGTLAQLGLSSTSPQGYYTMAITTNTATAYTITATGTGTQTSDAEGSTACNVLTLTVTASATTQSPSACWPT